MVSGGRHCSKGISSGWKIAFFRQRTSRGGADNAEPKGLRAHSDLRILIGHAGYFLHRPDTFVSIPAGAGADFHSVFDGVAIRIGRANAAAGCFDAFGGNMGRRRADQYARYR